MPTFTAYSDPEYPGMLILPEIHLDASNPADTDPLFYAAKQAEFVLKLTLLEKVDFVRLSNDVNQLLTALRDYEVELGGEGLHFDEESTLAFRVSAKKWEGAPERLQALQTAITHPESVAKLEQAICNLREQNVTVAV